MSYRKIEVNEKIYEYTVGKTHIKIKEIGVFPIVGNSNFFAERCECCGESLAEIYGSLYDNVGRLGVTPKNIRALILKHV